LVILVRLAEGPYTAKLAANYRRRRVEIDQIGTSPTAKKGGWQNSLVVDLHPFHSRPYPHQAHAIQRKNWHTREKIGTPVSGILDTITVQACGSLCVGEI